MFTAKDCYKEDTPETIVPLAVNAIDVLYHSYTDFSNLYFQQILKQKTPIIGSVIREIWGPSRNCSYRICLGAATNIYIKNLLCCFTLRYYCYQYNVIFANASILKTPYMSIDLLAPYAYIHIPADICPWLTSMDISFRTHRIQQMTVSCTLYSIFPLCKLADGKIGYTTYHIHYNRYFEFRSLHGCLGANFRFCWWITGGSIQPPMHYIKWWTNGNNKSMSIIQG